MNTEKGQTVAVGYSDSSAVCDCWQKTDALLRESGFKISDACSAFVLTQTTLEARHYLPIQRADGGKRKMSDPKGIAISHCPFCGRSLLPNHEAQARKARA